MLDGALGSVDRGLLVTRHQVDEASLELLSAQGVQRLQLRVGHPTRQLADGWVGVSERAVGSCLVEESAAFVGLPLRAGLGLRCQLAQLWAGCARRREVGEFDSLPMVAHQIRQEVHVSGREGSLSLAGSIRVVVPI